MIKPKPLKNGDKVGLIGPCSPVVKERIEQSIDFIKSLGLEVVLGKSATDSHGFLSGTDDVRAKDINMMFEDKNIKGIFVIRGGYGASRLLHLIDYEMIKKNPKVFAGYSDVTALHNVFNQRCKFLTYHTPMVSTEFYKGVDDYTMKYFKNNVLRQEPLGKINNPPGFEKFKSLVSGKAKGMLVGGNLSVVASTMGTPYEVNTKGKILFLEEVEEPPYKIDRMLLQLKQCGKFKDASGIILGAWTDCKANDESRSLSLGEVFNELIVTENKPTLYNIRCGHCIPTISLPLGSQFIIDADKNEIIDLGVKK